MRKRGRGGAGGEEREGWGRWRREGGVGQVEKRGRGRADGQEREGRGRWGGEWTELKIKDLLIPSEPLSMRDDRGTLVVHRLSLHKVRLCE